MSTRLAFLFAALSAAGCSRSIDLRPVETSTATVVLDGSPLQGATVILHAPDGTPVETVTTGADGLATFRAPAGCAVTAAIVGSGGFAVMITEFDLPAPFAITLGPPPAEEAAPAPPALAQQAAFGSPMHVTWPAKPGTDRYELSLGCGPYVVAAPTTSADLTFASDCLDANNELSLLAYAFDQNTPTGFTWIPDQPSNQDAALPAWEALPEAMELTVTDPPQGASLVFVRSALTVMHKGWAMPATDIPPPYPATRTLYGPVSGWDVQGMERDISMSFGPPQDPVETAGRIDRIQALVASTSYNLALLPRITVGVADQNPKRLGAFFTPANFGSGFVGTISELTWGVTHWYLISTASDVAVPEIPPEIEDVLGTSGVTAATFRAYAPDYISEDDWRTGGYLDRAPGTPHSILYATSKWPVGGAPMKPSVVHK